MSADFFFLLPMWYVVFLFSITCHEGAHALAAKLGGDLTAFREGQVSLNPVPHVRREPLGTVAVPLISYLLGGWMIGWASAPYDPTWQARYPHRAGWMALAGPGANFLLAILAGVAIYVGVSAGIFVAPHRVNFTQVTIAASPGFWSSVAVLLSITFSLNVLLGAFNLIPVPPLDGSTAIGLLLSEEKALRFAEFSRNPSFFFIGIIIAWNVFDWLFPPVFILALNLLYPGAGYH